jgi:hypothetical protein
MRTKIEHGIFALIEYFSGTEKVSVERGPKWIDPHNPPWKLFQSGFASVSGDSSAYATR